jgi:hypothetical protein
VGQLRPTSRAKILIQLGRLARGSHPVTPIGFWRWFFSPTGSQVGLVDVELGQSATQPSRRLAERG